MDLAATFGREQLLVGPETLGTADDSWWDEGRRSLLVDQLTRIAPPPSLVLDMGCGRGSLSVALAAAGARVVATDGFQYPEWACGSGVAFVRASADAMPFRDGVFDVAGSFDVLEHLPDESGALGELTRVTSQAGAVVVTVPAFPALWSAHDVAVGHHRRHTSASMRTAMQSVGLRPKRSTYFFSFLFPPAWVMRKRRQSNSGDTGG
jgi:ubiquinone/menaquinone biosynthesis C-methylase UbiE